MYASMHACVHACMYVCMYVCMCVCVCMQFSIEWPPIAYKMIAWFQSTFKFEVLQMPGLYHPTLDILPDFHTFSV